MLRLKLTRDAIGPVSRGHPWVYTDGLRDAPPPPGEPVVLLDGRDKPVGFGLSDTGDIAVRVLGRYPDRIPDLIARRVAAAADSRPPLLPTGTDAYRVLNGAGDNLPGVVVDRYGALAVLRLYGACWRPWLDELVDAISHIDGINTVLRRLGVQRVDGRSGADLLFGPAPEDTLVVQECGLRFLVRPYVGQKTGLFLDQREHRRQVGQISAGQRRVVNLFAYTGGFSVYAAAAGAKQVVTVDISEEAVEDARENFRLNDLNPEAHIFAAADAFRFEPDNPGLLVCDPPALSRSQKSDRSAARAYRDLATQCGRSLSGGGLLATASCTARLSQDRWEDAVRDGLKKAGRWAWLWRAAEPPDHPISSQHPEGRYLKFGLLRKLA